MYYNPFEDAAINDIKHALVERIGAECTANEIPFFLEFVGYALDGDDAKGPEYARRKPEIVTRSMAEFSLPRYGVDVLKVEIPVNTSYMEGSVVFQRPKVYSKPEVMEYFRAAAAAATKPCIYLSAGVSNQQFVESLHLAGEAGVDFSGVLCGRATWKDGIPVYARDGVKALEDWLGSQGVKNITAVNDAIRAAKPWYAKFGLTVDELI